MKKQLSSIACLLVLNLFSFSQNWNQVASMYDYGRVSGIGCSVNGRAYVGLGQNSKVVGGPYVNDFWEYNPESNLWTQKTSYPGGGRQGATAYTSNGKVYVFFGFDANGNSHNDVWEYDPATNNWNQKTSLPAAGRFNARGFVISDSLIYIGTGSFNNGYNYLYDFWQYNTTTDIWTKKADFAGGKRMAAASFAINGIGFLGTGLFDTNTPTNDFWSYNPISNSWSAIANYPAARFGLVNFELNNEGYAGTGDDYSQVYTDFWKYNAAKNSWSKIASPATKGRLGGNAFTINNIAYTGMGWNKNSYFTDMWSFKSDSVIVTEHTNVLEQSSPITIIYPNPTTGKVTIEINAEFNGKYTLTLYSIAGENLLTNTVEILNSYNLDLSKLANGTYFLNLKNEKGQFTKKIVLQK